MRSHYTCNYKNDDLDIDVDGVIYSVDVEATATYSHDDGCMYMRNGDPGYPPEDDFDIDEVNINSVTLIDEEGNVSGITDAELLKKIKDKVRDYLSDHEDYFISDEEE